MEIESGHGGVFDARRPGRDFYKVGIKPSPSPCPEAFGGGAVLCKLGSVFWFNGTLGTTTLLLKEQWLFPRLRDSLSRSLGQEEAPNRELTSEVPGGLPYTLNRPSY